jgi:hypothetical protein
MVPYGVMRGMGHKVDTCVYLDREIIETARRLGLNVSRVSGNALAEAIGRLTGAERATGLGGGSLNYNEGRGRDLNPGARLHRPIGYQATSPRPLFYGLLPYSDHCCRTFKGYLPLRSIFPPSLYSPVTYSKPASMRTVASPTL